MIEIMLLKDEKGNVHQYKRERSKLDISTGFRVPWEYDCEPPCEYQYDKIKYIHEA